MPTQDHIAHRLTRALLAASLVAVLAFSAGCNQTSPPSAPPSVSTLPASPSETTTPPSTVTPPASSRVSPTVFAIIGDFGMDDRHERAVAKLVDSWNPSFIVTTGDNYYRPAGGRGAEKYDRSALKHYGKWMGVETTRNAFFPALGNHDYSDATPSLETYLDYFDLPGKGFANTSSNERYYDFIQGPIHFFVINSNADEPDGITRESIQAKWLKNQLAASTSRWNVVCMHHPPYSSDTQHGSTRSLQWPFAKWGADVVVSGHAHTYERVQRNGIVYFVNGLGGAPRYGLGDPVKGSKKRYGSDWGAQRVTVTEAGVAFEFYNIDGDLVDEYRLSPQR